MAEFEVEVDNEAGISYIKIAKGYVAQTETSGTEVWLDRDVDGRILGIEIFGVLKIKGQ